LGGIEISALVADKGFDNDALRQKLDAGGTTAVIPPKPIRARQIACNFAMYHWRHLVENSIFTKLGNKGTEASPFKLYKKNFANDKAEDKDDYIVYNKKTGVISYDADGSGKGKAVEIASVTKGLKLNYDDFFVI